MPKPYRKFRIKSRGGKIRYGYVSKLSGKRISAETKSENWRVQGRREAFSKYDAESWKRFDETLADWVQAGVRSPKEFKEKSPDIQRYIDYRIEHDHDETLADIIEIEISQRMRRARNLSEGDRIKRANRKLIRKPRKAGKSLPRAKKRAKR